MDLWKELMTLLTLLSSHVLICNVWLRKDRTFTTTRVYDISACTIYNNADYGEVKFVRYNRKTDHRHHVYNAAITQSMFST